MVAATYHLRCQWISILTLLWVHPWELRFWLAIKFLSFSIGLFLFFWHQILFCSNFVFWLNATWSLLSPWFSCSRRLSCLRDLSCRVLCFPAIWSVFWVQCSTSRHPTCWNLSVLTVGNFLFQPFLWLGRLHVVFPIHVVFSVPASNAVLSVPADSGHLALWPYGLSGPALVFRYSCPVTLFCPGPLASWLSCPLARLAAWLRAFVPCFGPLCLASGLCALLRAFVPCFGSLCLTWADWPFFWLAFWLTTLRPSGSLALWSSEIMLWVSGLCDIFFWVSRPPWDAEEGGVQGDAPVSGGWKL